MISINGFYAYKGDLTNGESKPTFNNGAETLTIQVDGLAGKITLHGAVDTHSDIFYKMTGFDGGYEHISEITTDGIYSFSIEGIGKFKFEAENTNTDLKVFCRMTRGGITDD